MPESRRVLLDLPIPGRYGAPGPDPVCIMVLRRDVVQIAAFKGRDGDLGSTLRRELDLTLPSAGQSSVAGALTALAIQPHTWLITAAAQTEGELARRLKLAADGQCAVVDQSHGRGLVRLAGRRAREVLARLCRVDLHPSVFGPGRVAVTPVADLPCILHQTDGEPGFDILVIATYAGSFIERLMAAAATTGCVIEEG